MSTYGIFTATGCFERETDEPENVPTVGHFDVATVTDEGGWFVYRDASGDVIGSAQLPDWEDES